MKWWWRSGSRMDYESVIRVESKSRPGVTFAVRRISFERRLELIRRIREVAQRIEFLEAGKDPHEGIEASLLAAEVDRIYLLWGLTKVEGLAVDGREATPELLAEAGPEDLCREAVAAIKAECGLTDEERKN